MGSLNVGEIIKSKKPTLYKKIPRFIIIILEKIVCQKRFNDILEKFGHLKNVDFISASLNYTNIKRSSVGLEKANPNGRYIIASNHPLGGIDGICLGEILKNYFGNVRLIVNDILMEITPINNICIPVNKHGRQNSKYAQKFEKELSGDAPILYFPAGLCSRKINGVITDLKWQKSFVQKAIEHKRDIIPTYVNDKNSNFFYNVGVIRKKLGIKFNIEMILLPKEVFKKENKGNINIIFGEPITYERLINENRSITEWVEYIREITYNLAPKERR